MSPRRTAGGILCLALLLARLALGAGDEARTIPAAALEREALRPGARVTVAGKYKELLDRDLHLFDCRWRFMLNRPELKKQILDFKAQRDNVLVRGTVVTSDPADPRAQGAAPRAPGEDALAVEVHELEAAPSDVEVFSRELQEVLGARGERARAAAALLRRMLVSYERHEDPEIVRLFRRGFAEGLRLEDPAAVGEALALLEAMHASFHDKQAALEMALLLESAHRGDPRIPRFITALGCRRHRGAWVTHEAWKEKQGFVLHDGSWVLPGEKHFLETQEKLQGLKHQVNLILRRRTDREYQLLAEKGALEEGMRPEEVCAAAGFPERVERRPFLGKDLTQWRYGGRYCYFFDGLLVGKPGK
ncbi:MAG: hypothetical protein HY721_13610 [Planctomycetes bacterium]|nr:hypothetical protein [Planctomycetota bacterium]